MDHSVGALLAEPSSRLWLGEAKAERDLCGLPPLLTTAGHLQLRLAATRREVRKIQRLRYRVFTGARASDGVVPSSRRDKCPFDRACDHLLVVDTAARRDTGEVRPKVVGTYRLLRGEIAAAQLGFYSATEFVLDPLLARHSDQRFLELGRSCVHPDFRSRRVIDLLWHGVGLYAAHHRMDVLIGCSSLPGTHTHLLAEPLGFALRHAASPPDWQVVAMPGRRVCTDGLQKAALDPRLAFLTLPPLMKAYVRAGASFSSEAVVDHAFGTVDLFTVLPLAMAAPRYVAQFGPGLRLAS